jgi:serine/threonine-protein kinase
MQEWCPGSDADAFRPRLPPGTQLNGIYEIDRLIGVGGMGEVYKGRAIETGHAVAIKLMLPELAQNEAALALFRREASALHHLQHEAIVRYYVFTIEPALQRPYLAMEFVDGRSLSQLLDDDGPLSYEAVCSLMRRIASGLQAAHESGVVHRDVTPGNIIIPGRDVGRAKIIDFGIARSTEFGDTTVIGSGFAGKYNYVSPEQLGLFDGDVTAKSDIYSFGLVLAQALAGQALDMGGTQLLPIMDKRRALPDLGAIDARLRPLLEAMLQPNPAQRLESMAAVAAWSSPGVPSGHLDTGTPADARGAASTTPRNRRRRYAVMGLALISTFAGAGWYYYSSKPPPRPPPVAKPHTAEEIRQYVQKYEGGECFFITPVAIGETDAALEGLGASLQPFNRLDDEFKRDYGFEADIAIRQVTPAQCPAVTFLARLRDARPGAPRIDVDSINVRSGEPLTGLVDRYGTRDVDLLVVDSDGTVENVSNLLRPGTDAKTFSIPMQPRQAVTSGSEPRLLLAVASAAWVQALRPGRPLPADSFFSAVLAEKARSGASLAATARYFRFER